MSDQEPEGVGEAREALLSGGRITNVYAHVGTPGGHNNDRITLTMESGTTVSFDAYSGGDIYIRVAVKPLEPAPTKFLFGFDDPFEDGGMYVWIVGEEFFREEGYVDDSSTASSAIPPSKREALQDQTDENGWDLSDKIMDEANTWLNKATKGILYGEGMESCWDTGWQTEYDQNLADKLGLRRNNLYDGKTREEAQEEIKAALIERGFVYEPKLEST